MNLINNEENHFFGIYDNNKYYVNKTTSKKPGNSNNYSKGTSKSTSKPNSSSNSKSNSSSGSRSSSTSSSSRSSSISNSKSNSSSGSRSSSSTSNSKSTSSSSNRNYNPSSGASPTAIKNADNRNTGYGQANSGYKQSTSSSSRSSSTSLSKNLGNSARNKSPYDSNSARNKSPYDSNYRSSSTNNNNVTGTVTRNNFLGGYTGSQLRGSTTVLRNQTSNNKVSYHNRHIEGLDYLNKNNVSYLDKAKSNNTINREYSSKATTSDFDLNADARSRGKNVTNSNTTNIPNGGTFLGGFSTGTTRGVINANIQQGTHQNSVSTSTNNMNRQTTSNDTINRVTELFNNNNNKSNLS